MSYECTMEICLLYNNNNITIIKSNKLQEPLYEIKKKTLDTQKGIKRIISNKLMIIILFKNKNISGYIAMITK